jgi:hypothetical protein
VINRVTNRSENGPLRESRGKALPRGFILDDHFTPQVFVNQSSGVSRKHTVCGNSMADLHSLPLESACPVRHDAQRHFA